MTYRGGYEGHFALQLYAKTKFHSVSMGINDIQYTACRNSLGETALHKSRLLQLKSRVVMDSHVFCPSPQGIHL